MRGPRPAVLHPHRLGLLPDDVRALLSSGGHEASESEVTRLFAAAHRPSGAARSRHPVAKRLTTALEAATRCEPLEVIERAADAADGFVKYLFRSPDGSLSEAVRIPLHKPGRFSVCLSSQVGCALGCVFCATGRLGLTRNLAVWEMVAALHAVRSEAPGEVTGAVFMGQGEPFQNYDAVLGAARILSHPVGGRIAAGAITISTVGLVPEIRRFARDREPYRLVVSLSSAIAERRAALLPVAGRTLLGDLAAALGEYAAASRTRVTVAWVVLGGVNTGAEEVEALRELLGHLPLRINIIDVNDARPDGFARAGAAELAAFRDRLGALGVPVVRRYSGGATRHAACGMLAAVRQPAPEAVASSSHPSGALPPASSNIAR